MTDRSDTVGSTPVAGSAARLAAGAAVLAGGLVHLQLYFDGYRNLPDPNLGRSFVANGVASVIVAIALVWRREAIVRLAGIGVAIGTLGAFALSRTDRGVFGLRETGLQPSPQALIALVAELAAITLLSATFLRPVGAGRALPRRIVIGIAAAATVAAAGSSALWARSDGGASVAAPATPSNVTIANFAFDSNALTVAAGTSVTWTNSDSFAHSIVGRDGTFKSEKLATGESFVHTFDAPGTYAYVCGIHPSMAGTVVVTG